MTKNQKQKNLINNEANDLNTEPLTMKESITINDGVHNGTIVDVKREIRNEYDYTDIYVEITDDKGNIGKIKTGFPTNLSTKSTLGKFLQDAGLVISIGEDVTIKEVSEKLTGKVIQFTTYTENDFPRIVNKSIKFIGE